MHACMLYIYTYICVFVHVIHVCIYIYMRMIASYGRFLAPFQLWGICMCIATHSKHACMFSSACLTSCPVAGYPTFEEGAGLHDGREEGAGAQR